MLRFLFVALTLLTWSCGQAQSDKILLSDSVLRVQVTEADLTDYLTKRKISDTSGRSNEILTILKHAKSMYVMSKKWKFAAGNIKTFDDALEKAEENFVLRNQVDLILVIKHQRKMLLLKKGKIVTSFVIALGPNPIGQKESEGDGRTPEGKYTLDWQRHHTSVFHSFHISYPNKVDSARAKVKKLTPGSNIMVHGTSPGIKRRKDWTNGCIALRNEDMIEFKKLVYQDTPIEIRK